LKDKHVKLKLAAALVPVAAPVAMAAAAVITPSQTQVLGETALTPEAILVPPRCHPDGAAIPRAAAENHQPRTENGELRTGSRTENRELRTQNWRRNITFVALGWHMAERLQAANLLAGDILDIAFTVGHNDHPEYGGLELSLRDFQIPGKNP